MISSTIPISLRCAYAFSLCVAPLTLASSSDWDAIARRDGTGPGAHARAMEKKSDKKIAVPQSGPHPTGQTRTPWMDWVAPALHDQFVATASAAATSAHPAELHTRDATLDAYPAAAIPRARSSRLMQRCKSLWKLSPSQMDLKAADMAVE